MNLPLRVVRRLGANGRYVQLEGTYDPVELARRVHSAFIGFEPWYGMVYALCSFPGNGAEGMDAISSAIGAGKTLCMGAIPSIEGNRPVNRVVAINPTSG